MQQPSLSTERLLLRPFTLHDAAEVQRLAGDATVARMTGNVPHPYEDGLAESWIATHQPNWQQKTAVTFAVTSRVTGKLMGTISLTQISAESANLGYWIGRPYWGHGYCTEAGKKLLEFAFAELGLPMVYVRHLPDNQASKRVIQKLGFYYQREVTVSIKEKNRRLKHYTLYAEQMQSTA